MTLLLDISIMARKTKEEAERTYHSLLDAAATLFIRQGVAKTTLAEIAKEAGLTRGAIYWHFDNKDAVIQALWERNADKLDKSFRELVAFITPEQAAGSFRKTIKEMIQSIVKEPELGQIIRIVMHSVEFTDEQTELQQFLFSKKSEFHNAMEDAFKALKKYDALKSDKPVKLLSDALLSYTHGLIHDHLSPSPINIDLAKDGNDMVDLFLDAILK